jgi:hypothetical protein
LVAQYELNGNAIDQSGNGFNGLLHGTTPTTDRFGNPNSALLFNGTSDYIDLPNDFDFTQRTLSLWLKVNVFPTTGSPNPGAYVFISDNPSMQFGATGIFVNQISGVNQIVHLLGGNGHNYQNALTNTWYHAAIVVNATYIKYYINGAVLDSVPRGTLGSSAAGHSTALIGVSRNLDRFFDGAIDDVRIYDCALSNAEINQLYLGEINCQPVAIYKLDGNATDQSGNNYNGVLHGTTPTTDRFGNPNSALLFNGTSDYIDLPDDFDFTQRTLSLWLKANVFPTTGSPNPGAYVFISDNPTMQYGATGIFVNQISGVNQILHLLGGNGNNYQNALTNTWYHAAIVVNATYIKYYINGVVLDSIPRGTLGSSAAGHSTALIGVSRNLDRFFDGAIDDVRIYDCALSNADIDSLYDNFGAGIKEIVTENVISVFPNPATEKITIENPNSNYRNYLITIKNIQGQEVFNKKLNFTTSYIIDVSGLSSGVYLLTMQNEKVNYMNKIIIQK